MIYPDKDSYRRIKEYFENREEIVDAPHFDTLRAATSAALIKYQQDKDPRFNPDFVEQKRLALVLENMVGYPSERTRSLNLLMQSGKSYLSKLSSFPEEQVDIDKAFLMTNGSNQPVYFIGSINNASGETLSKGCYAKPFDLQRIVGLELYGLVGGIERDYPFVFNDGVIVEAEMQGRHFFDLPEEEAEKIKKLGSFKRDIIKSNILSYSFGLDDIVKQDNYLVNPDGKMIIIDFDVQDNIYEKEERERIDGVTQRQLNISREEYREIFREEYLALAKRVLLQKEKVSHLANILANAKSPVTRHVGLNMASNVLNFTNSINSRGVNIT